MSRLSLSVVLCIALVALQYIPNTVQAFSPSAVSFKLQSVNRQRAQAKGAELNMRWGLKGNNPAPTTTPEGVLIRDTGIYILTIANRLFTIYIFLIIT
jgi:hypothetical protein